MYTAYSLPFPSLPNPNSSSLPYSLLCPNRDGRRIFDGTFPFSVQPGPFLLCILATLCATAYFYVVCQKGPQGFGRENVYDLINFIIDVSTSRLKCEGGVG